MLKLAVSFNAAESTAVLILNESNDSDKSDSSLFSHEEKEMRIKIKTGKYFNILYSRKILFYFSGNSLKFIPGVFALIAEPEPYSVALISRNEM